MKALLDLFKQVTQEEEFDAIRIGLVHQRASRYVSDETLSRRREQKKRIRRILDGLLATNELGQCYTLSELAELGMANPRIRRSSPSRIRGSCMANGTPSTFSRPSGCA